MELLSYRFDAELEAWRYSVCRGGSEPVERRFSEFDALRSTLIQELPWLASLPFPEKGLRTAVQDLTTEWKLELASGREEALRRWLRCVASQPEAEATQHFRRFFEN